MNVSKRMLTSPLLLCLAAGLFLYSIPSVLAIPNVYVFPASVSAASNDYFIINIEISGAVDVFGWEFQLGWNASVLDFIDIKEGSFLEGIEENPTFFVSKIYQDQVGIDTIGVGCTRLGYVSGVDGSGTLATVTFRVEATAEAPATTALDLFETHLADGSKLPSPIEHTSADGVFTVSYHQIYVELLGKYDDLLADYVTLNSTHHSLESSYDSLQASYSTLNSTHNNLKSEHEVMESDLGTVTNLNYLLIAATIIFVATTAYLMIRKPKVRA